LGFRLKGSGFRVKDSGFRVKALGYRVKDGNKQTQLEVARYFEP
jgi:hypothetical protein